MAKKINSNHWKQKLSEVTLGSDPEIYLTAKNGHVKSSIPILKKDKNDPIVLDKKNGIKIFSDNSLAEFSFNPSHSKKEFVGRYKMAFKTGQKFLGDKYRFKIKSAHIFKENELEAAYGIDPMQVGCNPEYDFRKLEIRNLGPFTNTMRSGSSHIHLGHKDLLDYNLKHDALRVIEIYLGCASIIWDNDETSKIRRTKYGQSGSFRPTPWGVEARFMSNYMLNSPKLVALTYDLIKYSLSHVFKGTYKDVIKSVDENDVQNAINFCNKDLAQKILIQAKLPNSLMKKVLDAAKKKKYNFYSEWGIKH